MAYPLILTLSPIGGEGIKYNSFDALTNNGEVIGAKDAVSPVV